MLVRDALFGKVCGFFFYVVSLSLLGHNGDLLDLTNSITRAPSLSSGASIRGTA